MILRVRLVPEKGPRIRAKRRVRIQQPENSCSWQVESGEMLISVREIIPPNLMRYGLSVVECSRLKVENRKISK